MAEKSPIPGSTFIGSVRTANAPYRASLKLPSVSSLATEVLKANDDADGSSCSKEQPPPTCSLCVTVADSSAPTSSALRRVQMSDSTEEALSPDSSAPAESELPVEFESASLAELFAASAFEVSAESVSELQLATKQSGIPSTRTGRIRDRSDRCMADCFRSAGGTKCLRPAYRRLRETSSLRHSQT